eukprot:1842669-Pyramimonas_sp.AAC.1
MAGAGAECSPCRTDLNRNSRPGQDTMSHTENGNNVKILAAHRHKGHAKLPKGRGGQNNGSQ